MDSPARIPFAILLCAVAALLLVFAAGVRHAAAHGGRSQLTAYLIGFMALAAAGVDIFPFPNPLHNIFGESELIGYQAPLALALGWRNDARSKRLVTFSWIMFALIWFSVALNLSSLDRHGPIWAHMRPVCGLVQRSLFVAWFGWCAGVGGGLFFVSGRAKGTPKASY